MKKVAAEPYRHIDVSKAQRGAVIPKPDEPEPNK